MPEVATSFSGQNPKLLIATALITAATTIGVAFVGIFPQLRNSQYEKLQKEFDQFKQNASKPTPPDNGNVTAEKKVSVSGTVFNSADRKRTLNGVEIYLLPEGNSLLTAKTDDNGMFTFKEVPKGIYSIIVRDSTGRSGKGLLDDSGDEVTVIGASIKYRFRDLPSTR